MKSTWHDYHTTTDDREVENAPSLEIVNLLNHSGAEICVTNVAQNNNLAMLTIDPMEDELVMLHHFAQI